VHELTPDFVKLGALDGSGVIVTAPGAGHDFVSRYFAPKHGLNEDHATGSSHCTLVPYWAERLGKVHLRAHQVSHRAGELWCELKGKRVLLGGRAVTFSRGTITV
jgi:predicted PhzF superfamily epimerase YddE/YHI9